MNNSLISLCLILFLISNHLFGQQPQLPFRNYNSDQGLPSPEVYDILQDQAGYIWISTDNGVSRFNGYTFENFGPKQGLKNIVVLHLFEDTKGWIWMSTLSGNIYIYKNGKILPYFANNILQTYLEQNRQIRDFHVDSLGVFHGSLQGLGILKIDTSGQYDLLQDTLKLYQLVYPIESSVLTELVDTRDKSPGISITNTKGLALAFYQPQSDTWKERPLPIKQPGAIKRDDIAYRLSDDQILLYNRENIFLLQADSVLWQLPYPDRFNSILRTAEGLIYLGLSEGKGLRVYDNINALKNGLYKSYLAGLSVSHILKDRDEGLWIATQERGFFYAPNQRFLTYNQASGLTDNYVSAVTLKNGSEIFIGQYNGDILKLQTQSSQLELIYSNNEEINDLAYDSLSNRLWASSPRYIQYWDEQQWTPAYLLSTNNKKHYVIANRKFRLYPESGEIWGCNVGSSGFTQINTHTAQASFYSAFWKQLRFRTHIIIKDFSGRFWLGQNEGLFEFVAQDTSIKSYANLHEAFSYRVEDITQLKDSTLIVGTKGGGIILWKNDQLTQLGEEEGLTSNMIENIHVDHAQNIWVGTLNGLNKIVKNKSGQLEVETFTIADGLPSNTINDITSIDNKIWVATTQGLAHFPAIADINRQAKLPSIEEIRVNQKKITSAIIQDLNAQQNNLSFNVLCLNYRINGRINYRYRLHPEEIWTVTDNRLITFASLSPNVYRFEVQAKNEDGFWSDSTVLPFRIYPPFWKTSWFLVLSSLSLMGFIYMIYQNRISRLQKESQLEKEMYELRQSALRAQMNPHFIFNCLNSIQGFISEGETPKATRHLAKFSRLIRMVLNISLQATISLEEEIDMLDHYLQLEKMRFEDKFNYTIQVDNTIEDPAAIQIPPLLAQPYVENAIIHGFSDILHSGHISIVYALQNNHIQISIQDNGIGILTSQRRKNSSSSLYKSVGMKITHKRLELAAHRTQQELPSVQELKNERGEASGTRVIFYIALDNGFKSVSF